VVQPSATPAVPDDHTHAANHASSGDDTIPSITVLPPDEHPLPKLGLPASSHLSAPSHPSASVPIRLVNGKRPLFPNSGLETELAKMNLGDKDRAEAGTA